MIPQVLPKLLLFLNKQTPSTFEQVILFLQQNAIYTFPSDWSKED
jgi:hypothetical protein